MSDSSITMVQAVTEHVMALPLGFITEEQERDFIDYVLYHIKDSDRPHYLPSMREGHELFLEYFHGDEDYANNPTTEEASSQTDA